MIAQLKTAHAAAADGASLSTREKRDIYETFFRWEQVCVVGPDVDQAMAVFQWPLMKWFCLRPWVWLSYFRFGKSLNFRNFADPEERTQKGLIAFDRAAACGWDTIEENLLRNPLFDPNRAAQVMISLPDEDASLATTRPVNS